MNEDTDSATTVDPDKVDETTHEAVEAASVTFDLIVAVAANGVIGANGEMPWHIPADLGHFERTTTGHPVVMGRRTYDSITAQIGGPLPDRTSVVLSRDALSLPDGAVHAKNAPEAIRLADRDAARRGVERAYVAGGATVYDAFLPIVDRLVRTEIHDSYEGDTRFPEWNRDAWRVVDRDERDGFAFVTYERRD